MEQQIHTQHMANMVYFDTWRLEQVCAYLESGLLLCDNLDTYSIKRATVSIQAGKRLPQIILSAKIGSQEREHYEVLSQPALVQAMPACREGFAGTLVNVTILYDLPDDTRDSIRRNPMDCVYYHPHDIESAQLYLMHLVATHKRGGVNAIHLGNEPSQIAQDVEMLMEAINFLSPNTYSISFRSTDSFIKYSYHCLFRMINFMPCNILGALALQDSVLAVRENRNYLAGGQFALCIDKQFFDDEQHCDIVRRFEIAHVVFRPQSPRKTRYLDWCALKGCVPTPDTTYFFEMVSLHVRLPMCHEAFMRSLPALSLPELENKHIEEIVAINQLLDALPPSREGLSVLADWCTRAHIRGRSVRMLVNAADSSKCTLYFVSKACEWLDAFPIEVPTKSRIDLTRLRACLANYYVTGRQEYVEFFYEESEARLVLFKSTAVGGDYLQTVVLVGKDAPITTRIDNQKVNFRAVFEMKYLVRGKKITFTEAMEVITKFNFTKCD